MHEGARHKKVPDFVLKRGPLKPSVDELIKQEQCAQDCRRYSQRSAGSAFHAATTLAEHERARHFYERIAAPEQHAEQQDYVQRLIDGARNPQRC